ncbi:MAG: acid phosphatase [Bacteroidota bacterium]|nr:acid phosphatase [Bacteroidota bacterium]
MRINYQIPKNISRISSIVMVIAVSLILTGCGPKKEDKFDEGIKQIKHVVVIYMENHSFDNLYGQFDGANGLPNPTDSTVIQIDSNNVVYKTLPPGSASSEIPSTLPNRYFNIDQYIRPDKETPDVLHQFYEEQIQIDSGKMNKFAAYNSKSHGLSMGYYTTKALPLYPIAEEYTLCDSFFHSAFGGSFLNHQWLISAATPVFKNSQDTTGYPKHDKHGHLVGGRITRDGFVINTSYSVNHPRPDTGKYYYTNPNQLVENLTATTIGDLLTAKGVKWGWYSGGWDMALLRGAKYADSINFQYHHQPFIYYKKYADGTKAKAEHLRDEQEFLARAKNGTLLPVSFVKPLGTFNEHPFYSTVKQGEDHAVELINAVLNGPNGKDVLIILTYDENGGFWDHVRPPAMAKDKMGPGSRVPAIIISPFAKKGFVDHTQYETVSILAFIEKRFGLPALTERDKKANPFRNAFNF